MTLVYSTHFYVAWYHSQTARAIKGSFITYHRLSVTPNGAWDAFLDKHYPAKPSKHVSSSSGSQGTNSASRDMSKLAAKASDTHATSPSSVDSVCSKYSEYNKWAALPSVVSWSVSRSPSRAKFSGQRAQDALKHGPESAGKRWDQLPSVVTWKTVTHSCPTKVPILAAGHACAQQEAATRGEGGAGAMGLIWARGWGDGGAWSRYPSVVTWSSPRLAVGAVEAMAGEGGRAGGEACSRPVTLGGFPTPHPRASPPKQGPLPVQLIGSVVTTPVHA